MRLLIIGCGNIGSGVAREAEGMSEVSSVSVLDGNLEKVDSLCQSLSKAGPASALSEAIQECDLVCEAASPEAAREVLPLAMAAGKDCLLMSMGALVDDAFREEMLEASRKSGARIIIPSGAICGLDGLRAASVAEIDEVELITTKSAAGFAGSPLLEGVMADAETLTSPRILFQGSAREAVVALPRNVNVAAAVSLSGVGFDRTKVTVVLDPAARRNRHELRVRGSFGEIRCEASNEPSPENPASSYLAALSAISALRLATRGGLVMA